ncbi:MAG: HPF/RaiA family ribosome-associated protein [Gammaproteobacteria bacterium]|nr:HPF/RaiA family ribosome-associated protein [Gammaproteobacteria bacterium]
MKLPLQITTRRLDLSKTAAAIIRSKAEKLERYYEDIMACRVMVETPHKHKQHGAMYNVRIDLTIPGAELVVRREPHQDIYIAIRDAFDAAKRQLLDNRARRRADLVRNNNISQQGKVSKLFPDLGYGFVETKDGREIYFSIDDLSKLNIDEIEVGKPVKFAETKGANGPHARSVMAQ